MVHTETSVISRMVAEFECRPVDHSERVLVDYEVGGSHKLGPSCVSLWRWWTFVYALLVQTAVIVNLLVGNGLPRRCYLTLQ